MLGHSGLPSLSQESLRLQILFKKTFLIRNSQEIQDIDNHVHVGYQNCLRKIGSELQVVLLEPLPELRNRLPEQFGIHFGKMSSRAESVVQLIGSEFADGYFADELSQALFTELQEHVGKLHKRSA